MSENDWVVDYDEWLDNQDDDWAEDIDGDTSNWITLYDCCCPRCESLFVRMQIWKSEKWDFVEYQFACYSCGHSWCIDSDSHTRKHLED